MLSVFGKEHVATTLVDPTEVKRRTRILENLSFQVKDHGEN